MFHVISISIFWLYQVPLYLILLYQFPDIGYIRFRYIKVCHISFHFCHIRFCYIKFQFGYIRFVISDSVISKSVISKGPSPLSVRINSKRLVAQYGFCSSSNAKTVSNAFTQSSLIENISTLCGAEEFARTSSTQ